MNDVSKELERLRLEREELALNGGTTEDVECLSRHMDWLCRSRETIPALLAQGVQPAVREEGLEAKVLFSRVRARGEAGS